MPVVEIDTFSTVTDAEAVAKTAFAPLQSEVITQSLICALLPSPTTRMTEFIP